MTLEQMKMERKLSIIIDGVEYKYLLCNFHTPESLFTFIDRHLFAGLQGIKRVSSISGTLE